MIRTLFGIFNEAAKTLDLGIFPYAYRDLLEEAGNNATLRTRLVCDYISGMTEHQAVDTHQRLMGVSRHSALLQ